MTKIGIIGRGPRMEARRQALEALPEVTLEGILQEPPSWTTADTGASVSPAAHAPVEAFLTRLDAVFLAVPTGDQFRLAEAAAKQGVHVYLDWPPATSIQECERIVSLAEEAGIEVGVSRLLRFHPALGAAPAAERAQLILVRRMLSTTAAPSPASTTWLRRLADAVDLCCALAQSSSVQRIDAEAVRGAAAWPEAMAFSLRFHSGAYAQVVIRRDTPQASHTVYLAGSGFQRDIDLTDPSENDEDATAYVSEPGWQADACWAETRAFLHALAEQRPPPVSILDSLHTLRLVERLMEKLR